MMTRALKALLLLSCLLVCGACTQQQIVKQPYPSWGKDIFLDFRAASSSLYMQLLVPERAVSARGCLLIVHGMNEYSGRYGRVARHFADRYIVAGVDLPAHGLSNPVLLQAHQALIAGAKTFDVSDAFVDQARLGDLGLMREGLHRALNHLIEQCDARVPVRQLPVFIVSHSLGSLVTAAYLTEQAASGFSKRIRGVIFSGPAFSVTEVPGWRGWFQNPFIRFTFHTHEHYLHPDEDEFLPLMAFNQLLALVTVPLQDGLMNTLPLPGIRQLTSPDTPDWVVNHLSDWEDERSRYRADMYIIRRTQLSFALAVEKEVIRFRRRMAEFDVPYLLIYSVHDPITPAWGNEDFVRATRDRHSVSKVVALHDESHHEQLFSRPVLTEKLLSRIDCWLEKRISIESE
jgi:alpha-beta hydrolase superfamily lysophospholipase